MKRWEYLVNTYEGQSDDELQAELDELGGDGWELVSVGAGRGKVPESSWEVVRVFLKRPV